MLLALFFLSAVGGFFAGFLGVGGAVILIPLLLGVPPLLGVGQLTMGQVSGVTMIQVLAASISGCLGHRRGGNAHLKTIVAIGLPMGICALCGAVLSKSMAGHSMLVVFGCLVALAFAMLLRKTRDEYGEPTSDFKFNVWLSGLIGGGVGLVSGIVGAGGGFILIPLMVQILRIPIRVAVGSSLGIVFIGALMGAVGKIMTLQVTWIYLLPVVLGSVPAAQFGVWASRKVPPVVLRYALLAVVSLTLVKTWLDIFSGGPH